MYGITKYTDRPASNYVHPVSMFFLIAKLILNSSGSISRLEKKGISLNFFFLKTDHHGIVLYLLPTVALQVWLFNAWFSLSSLVSLVDGFLLSSAKILLLLVPIPMKCGMRNIENPLGNE